MVCSSRMLQHTDAAVKILQDLVLIIGRYHESHKQAVTALDAPDLQAVELNYMIANELLASIWPCESQFVAVLGPTGCGKSTLLNNLLQLTCVAGEAYYKGINSEDWRAVLRETAKVYRKEQHVVCTPTGKEAFCSSDEHAGEALWDTGTASRGSHRPGDNQMQEKEEEEKDALAGLLGICCAKDTDAYLNEHLPRYDQHPFLLPSGRMGDAGTTKVTAIEWGLKFVGTIKWVSRKELRKQCRELRHLLQQPESELCEVDEARMSELKELWQSLLKVANLWSDSSVPRPDEARILELLTKLGETVSLGNEEVIGNPTTKGSMVDRLAVREGIHGRLCEEKLAVLVEEIRIQAPIPSLEGGVVLLDVPGTNDPRSLHKKETRDAISRVSLILLVLDKAVIDKATEKMLEENPVLERMLLAEDANCNLLVVGIAEKGNDGVSSSPEDKIANFDKGKKLSNFMGALFRKKAANLMKSKQIDRDAARLRLRTISDRISVLPVLPLLASSHHLSPSNGHLHKIFCESPDKAQCPLKMSSEEIKLACIRTNMPELLQKMHMIRRPPSDDDLSKGMSSALKIIQNLTQNQKIDISVADFLKREAKHMCKRRPESITVDKPPDVDMEFVKNLFQDCASKSLIGTDDMEAIKLRLASRPKITALLGMKAADLPQLEAMCLRGFQPGNIGPLVAKLMKPVEQQSTVFTEGALKKLVDANWQPWTARRIYGEDGLAFCVSLNEQMELQWELTLSQTRARCVDRGRNQLRMALIEANHKGVTHFLKQLKQCSPSGFLKTLTDGLSRNVMATKAAECATSSVKTALKTFWDGLSEFTCKDVQNLWEDSQSEIQKLSKSVAARVGVQETDRGGDDNGQGKDGCLIEFLGSLKDQERKLYELIRKLKEPPECTSSTEAEYGYSLLQKNQQFFPCDPGISQPQFSSRSSRQAGDEKAKTIDRTASGRIGHLIPLQSPRPPRGIIEYREGPGKLDTKGSNSAVNRSPSPRTPLHSPPTSQPSPGYRSIGNPVAARTIPSKVQGLSVDEERKLAERQKSASKRKRT